MKLFFLIDHSEHAIEIVNNIFRFHQVFQIEGLDEEYFLSWHDWVVSAVLRCVLIDLC